ncbi:OLC1v1022484C1 [Oldenlandia corymbosa var. corymbosa]|uniref:OLC1v1022484C1 n=1 Tax=Oldenlandia corymbosa var. corymbosa TaxID=529605 RepID=A0AAV1BXY5_OLDCO|nr:OLC1v1022484C1 [Oldenlandia corymbosa var. corymbosa]
MTTLEKLFVQIFERKNWIIQQVKQQTDLYNQHLASKLLVNGITPPSWLWNENLRSEVRKELNKEDLISEILLPHPRPVIHYPDACCSLYSNPFGERNEEVQVDGIFTDTPHSNNDNADVGNMQHVASGCTKNTLRCDMNMIHEVDVSNTNHPQPIISFPVTRDSPCNKAVGEGDEEVGKISVDTNSNSKFSDRVNDQGIASDHIKDDTGLGVNMVTESGISRKSPNDGTEASICSRFSAPERSVIRIQRSKSRQKALELRNSAKTESRSRLNQQNGSAGSSLANRLFMSSPAEDPITKVHDLVELVCSNHEENGETHEGKEKINEEKDFNSCTGEVSGLSCKKHPISTTDLVKKDSLANTRKTNDGPAAFNEGKEFSPSSKVLTLSTEVINPDVAAQSISGFPERREECFSLMENISGNCGDRIISPGASIDEDCFRHMEKKSGVPAERTSSPRAFLNGTSERDICDDFGMVSGGITSYCPGKSVQEFDEANDCLGPTDHSGGLVYGVRSQTMSGNESMPKLHDTPMVTAHVDIKSVSCDMVNSQTVNLVAWSSSDGQVILTSRNSPNTLNKQRNFQNVVSGVTVRDEPAFSRVISRDASLNCLLTRSSSDFSVFVEPKQLDFDEREECNFRDNSLPVECESSPSKVFDASLHAPSSSCHDTNSGGIIYQMLSTEEREVLATEKLEVGGCSLDRNNCSLSGERERCENSLDKVTSLHAPSSSDHDTYSGGMIHQKLSTEVLTKEMEVGECSLDGNNCCPPVECERSSLNNVCDAQLHALSSSNHDTSSGGMIHQKLSTVEPEVLTKGMEVGECSLGRNIHEHGYMEKMEKGSGSKEYSVLKNVLVDSEALPYVSNSEPSCSVGIIQTNDGSPGTENHSNHNIAVSELQNEGDFAHESTSAFHGSKCNVSKVSNVSSSAEKAIEDCSIKEVENVGLTNVLVSPDRQFLFEEDKKLLDLGSSGYACNVSGTQHVLESSSLEVNDLLTRGSVGSSHTGHEIFGISESRELQISEKPVVQNVISIKMDSWPRSKRRKIQDNETDCFSASPSFRIRKHFLTQIESDTVKNIEDNKDSVLGVASPVNESAHREVYQNMTLQLTEHQPQTGKFVLTSEYLGDNVEIISSSSLNQVCDPLVFNLTKGLARYSHLAEEKKKLPGNSSDGIENTDEVHLEGQSNLADGESLMMDSRHRVGKCNLALDGNLPDGLSWPHSKTDLDRTPTDQTMPVLEGFIIDPPTELEEAKIPGHAINLDEFELPRTSMERASILEQMCASAITQTPFTHFSSALNLDDSKKVCHSVPNGVLECMDLRSISSFNKEVQKQLRGSYMGNTDDHSFPDISQSDSLLDLGARYGWCSRNLSTSPIGKLWERTPLYGGSSSEKRLSSNPELMCFPIEEDPSFSEEEENASELTEKIQEQDTSFDDTCAKREPLAKITEENARTSIFAIEKSTNRDSVDSIATEVSFKGTCKKVKAKVQSHSKHNGANKENDILTFAANAVKKGKESTTNRFRKTTSSRKTSLKKEVQKLSEYEPKRNNIVSNVTSFIPLVKQKQAAAVCTGKRDVKVKALEKAEAAKRLEEQKENKRKLRKEALKLERVRAEQENLKQIELAKKKKEEERKKRDADVAAKKRQREEEERKEKERKRKKIEETHRMRREESTLCTHKTEKERQMSDIGERGLKAKVLDNRLQKNQTLVKGIKDGTIAEKPEDITIQTGISLETCATSGDPCDSEQTSAALERSGNTDNVRIEKSYEISPYHCSDDEDDDGEVEEERNKKYIPPWASKNCVALVLPLQRQIQPDSIFPKDSFCRLDEVCPTQFRRVIKMKGPMQTG